MCCDAAAGGGGGGGEVNPPAAPGVGPPAGCPMGEGENDCST